MSLKLPIEICSMKAAKWTVRVAAPTDVSTADFCPAPHTVRVVNNAAKAITIGLQDVDIRKINRALRNPREPAPELTAINTATSTR